jgi:hypothetical protein
MSPPPTAHRTARHNLVQRIERFLATIKDGRQPDVDAMANLAIALDCLERDDPPAGEDAMMLAEHGWAPRVAPAGEPRPLAELVARFGRLVAPD